MTDAPHEPIPSQHAADDVIPAVLVSHDSAPRSALASYDRPWIILVILFGVTAALGLPLLWYSRSFSRPAKVTWSVVVILYTALVLWLFFLLMRWSYQRIEPVLGI